MTDARAWMPFYVGDYLADTMHLDGPAHGAYFLLILHYWRTGPLPDDDDELAAIARTEPKIWTKLGPKIRRFFRVQDGALHHKRIDAEIARALDNSSKRRDAANARWMQRGSKPDALASDLQSERNDHAPAVPSSPPKKEKHPPTPQGGTNGGDFALEASDPRSPRTRGTRLAADWQPDDDLTKYALQHSVDPALAAEEFRNYWLGRAGKEAAKLDWPATFRNRVLQLAEAGRFPVRAAASGARPWNDF